MQAGDTVRYPYRIGLRGRAAVAGRHAPPDDAAVASAVPPFASAYAAHPAVGVRNGEAPRNAWQNRRYRFLSDVGEKMKTFRMSHAVRIPARASALRAPLSAFEGAARAARRR
ncbi:hypothetical protein NUV26_01235 [Burkholderia pseudomultivorans]|uniref:hypothetical protein n=1 Tax=Burkholderia pseudomultivorans TaxID=1207504 RepID=UPI002876396B|nr:hypothetical protein [Burkholderia pseudomultivorans]MDS0790758.1 hypothetical protein [Burkholderia pseudomultivorans]